MTCAATSSAVRLVTLERACLALLASQRGSLGVGQEAHALSRRVVQEVVPVALRGPVAEALELVAKLAVTVAIDGRRQLVGVAWRDPGEQVGDRVRVAAHEVHRPVQERLGAHQPGHLLPPASGHSRVADLGAAEHAHSEGHAVLGDLREPRTEGDAPDLVQLQPVVFAAAAGSREPLRGSASSTRSIPAPWRATRSLFNSIWSATMVGMRSSTSEALAMSTARVPSPSSYQRRRRPGALTSVHSVNGRKPRWANTSAD